MQTVPLPIARVSSQMSSSLLLGNLTANQVDLLKVQQQIATQQRLLTASDDPAATLGIEYLKRAQGANTQFTSNLNFAQGFLGAADNAMGSLSTLLTQAQSIASSQVGTGSSDAERAAQATVVDSLLTQAMTIANQKFNGASVFGGANGTQDPFASTSAGYAYQGTTGMQGILTPTGDTIDYTVDGNQIFGGLSAGITSTKNIIPLNANTQLGDFQNGTGVVPNRITVSTNSITVIVDVSAATTAGDVVNTVNSLMATDGINATIGFAGGKFSIVNNTAQPLTISNPVGSTTASDMGLTTVVLPMSTGTATPNGLTLSNHTLLSSLNLDPAGLQLTNGANSATISLTGLNTVGDLLNAINKSGVYARAEINAAGTGLSIYNTLSGSALKIGENGGTTATQLGVRTLDTSTRLADLNKGAGITPISATNPAMSGDIQITRRDGTSFTVDFTGAVTVQDALDKINNAAGNPAGATQVVASLNANGNGIHLMDPTTGSNTFAVSAINASPVAGQLGLAKSATAGAPDQITGDDVSGLMPQGVFTSLLALRNALTSGDSAAITRAGTALAADFNRVNAARGAIGAREQNIQTRLDQASTDDTQYQKSLSDLADTDMTKAITQFQQLQTAYEAALKAGAAVQNKSLLDFLS